MSHELDLYIRYFEPLAIQSDIDWAEARIKIARMTLTIKLDRNWNTFQLANCASPLGVTDNAIAHSARMSFVLRSITAYPANAQSGSQM